MGSRATVVQEIQLGRDPESHLPEDLGDLRQVPVSLSWEKLTVTVPDLKGKTREILKDASGYVEPGSLLAIMGASGGGKSTLLDALAGRLAKDAQVEGSVLVNGTSQRLSYGNSAYVTQDDAHLIGTLTVRESISYSARLRLPASYSHAEKDDIVSEVIQKMGLSEVADTYIGNWHIRGISGGQKRRVSIAMELITKPSLMFLDEPTSGLDSAAALFVTASIRKLASENRTILAVIHQPSSEVFALFDKLCLLSGGKTLFFGAASQALPMFEAAGVPCPKNRNPSDHFLRAINRDFEEVKSKSDAALFAPLLKGADPVTELSVDDVIQKLADTYVASPDAAERSAKVAAITAMQGPPLKQLLTPSVGTALRHTYILTLRSFTNMWRNVGLYWLRVVMYAMLMVCIGTIYYDIGDSYDSIQARGAVLFFVVAFLTFMSIAGFPAFIEDMKVFTRERLNGYYGVTASVLSNSLSSLPFLFLISLLSALIGYWLIKLQNDFGRFVYFVLMLFSSLAVVESLMMVIAAIVPIFLMGIAAGAGILGMFMLVCGFFRLPNDLPDPVWRYPFYYLSFHTYAFEGFMTNEFIGLTFENRPASLPRLTGEEALAFFDLQDKKKWNDLAVSVGMLVAYRLLFLLILKAKEWRHMR